MESKTFKIVSGTFVDGMASDIPSQNWSREDWGKQFDNMKKIGMDTIVVIRVAAADGALYNSPLLKPTLYPDEDMLELLFQESDRTGMNVYLGNYVNAANWRRNDWQTDVEINYRLIEEMWERYKTHKSFYGWYLSHEGGIEFHMPKVWKPIVEKALSYDSNKKILISPRYSGKKWHETNYPITPEIHYRQFDSIFSDMDGLIDYAAFMDGHAQFDELEGFLEATKKVCDKHNIAFWSNLETFDRDMAFKFPPIEWTKMRFKMEAAQPYVEKIITFEAPHFLSPYSMYPSAHKLYDRYCDYLAKHGISFD